jgi:hypothetical protein
MGLAPTLRSFGVLERQSSVRSAQGRSGQKQHGGRVEPDPDKKSIVIAPSRSPGGMGLASTLRSLGVLERQSSVRSAQGRSGQKQHGGRVEPDPDKKALSLSQAVPQEGWGLTPPSAALAF